MNTIYVEVDNEGEMLHFICERRSGVAITFPDGVWITTMPVPPGSEIPAARETKKPLGKESFPPRDLTEAAIVQVLAERGGTVKIRQDGWNIYDELAARLGVSFEVRQRPTPGTGEPAWRPEVGFARKNLEQRGTLAPTSDSGRGVWQLAVKSGGDDQ